MYIYLVYTYVDHLSHNLIQRVYTLVLFIISVTSKGSSD
jgi:hypothetical protein